MRKTAYIAGGTLLTLGLLIAIYLLFIAPTFVGNAGPDGDVLRKYLPPEKLKEFTEDPVDNVWIVDVRPRKAYLKGHIPTARNFPSSEIESRLDELPKEKYLILQCETGGRVQAVIKKLKPHGYTRYINWGGVGRWPYEMESGEGSAE